ncbi:MAG TPA: PfkB family carbohydrate kinase [Mobilitalea sp.]|nr:PfkB family carbohydrate kinase [Mobilitalea sp.]
MTIKDIAKVANVSVSTVSKIMNGKDDNMSDSTRERVLEVIKQFNYRPYANIRSDSSGKSLLLGVLIDGTSASENFIMSIISTAKSKGYSAIICTSFTIEEEYRNLAVLHSHGVDGILLNSIKDSPMEHIKYIEDNKLPYLLIDLYSEFVSGNYCFNYEKMGYALTEVLVKNRHYRIACVADTEDFQKTKFIDGFKQCMVDNYIEFDQKMVKSWNEEQDKLAQLLHGFTGIVCANTNIAVSLYKQAAFMNIDIPNDLSIVCIEEESVKQGLYPPVSGITLPFEQLGSYACSNIISMIETTKKKVIRFEADYALNHSMSVGVLKTKRKKIIVVGSVNMDTIISVGKFPEMGATIKTDTKIMSPGGKGLNRALEVVKLGEEAYLFGRIGKDYDGRLLYECLKENKVDFDGVISDESIDSGHAYISLQSDGESSIVVYNGANSRLTIADIRANEAVFENASYCLLDTEIQIEVVEYTSALAKKHGVKVILKPSSATQLSNELLRNIDIFIPNQKEIRTLLPGDASYEEKAQHYLDLGVGLVIITLGSKGAYVRDHESSRYFDATKVNSLDTTGAADVFAATIAVYLARNFKLETAVQYAIYAAGISTTRQGMPDSLVDQNTIETYFANN